MWSNEETVTMLNFIHKNKQNKNYMFPSPPLEVSSELFGLRHLVALSSATLLENYFDVPTYCSHNRSEWKNYLDALGWKLMTQGKKQYILLYTAVSSYFFILQI